MVYSCPNSSNANSRLWGSFQDLQHSGCRRRLAVNARAVCTFGARRACFVTAHKPLIPWHTSSWTAEYFKYSWHEVVAHWSGCAGRSHSQFRSSLVPDGRRVWKRSRRWTWHITTFITQFYFEGHRSLFFLFLIPIVPAFRKLYRIHQTWY